MALALVAAAPGTWPSLTLTWKPIGRYALSLSSAFLVLNKLGLREYRCSNAGQGLGIA